jgi:hypothetical protein
MPRKKLISMTKAKRKRICSSFHDSRYLGIWSNDVFCATSKCFCQAYGGLGCRNFEGVLLRLQVYRELSVFFGAPVACGCKALCVLSSATYIILNDKNSRKGWWLRRVRSIKRTKQEDEMSLWIRNWGEMRTSHFINRRIQPQPAYIIWLERRWLERGWILWLLWQFIIFRITVTDKSLITRFLTCL